MKELNKLNEFRNYIDKISMRNNSPKTAMTNLKDLVKIYGEISMDLPPFSFKLYIEDDSLVDERGGNKFIIDEADSVSMINLLETFKNDLKYEKMCSN